MTKTTLPIAHTIQSAEIRKILNVEKLREFTIAPTTGRSELKQDKSWPYKGSYKTFPKITNYAFITSYIEISDDGLTASGEFNKKSFSLKAPVGYKFGRDENGAKMYKIKSPKDDIHLDSLNVFEGVRALRRELLKNRAKRIELNEKNKQDKRIKLIFERNISNTVVTLEDSLKSGNCREGSLTLARRYKLDINFGVPAPILKKIKTKEPMIRERIQNAIKRAQMREFTVCI